MMWINGEVQHVLPASDRAIQFGDGCFTTACIKAGRIELCTAHLQRLQQDCQRLLISGVDWDGLQQEMCHAAAHYTDGVLKVIITRGNGGRGYSISGCGSPTRIITVSPYPQHYHQLREHGARLSISTIQLGKNPQLAGIKHLNRLEQVLIRAQCEQAGTDEALVLDSDAMLVECCAANVFWRMGEQVFTPDLSMSGVNGIQRRQVMKRLVELGFVVCEVRAGIAVLAEAEEVVITNALMPVLPVCQIEAWHYPSRYLFDLLALP